jgi:hypothetical protein
MTGHEDDALKTLRSRAYELADTGRYSSWEHVQHALQAEDFQMPRQEARGAKLFRELVTARCRRARAKDRPFPPLAALRANG